MQQAGVVEAAEARIATRAFAFGDLTAGALMTPRTEMEAVPVTATLGDLLALAETTRHSRLPVYEGSTDNLLGVLHVRDLFGQRNAAPGMFDLRGLVRPVLNVPESKHADDLLEEMRAHRSHIAVAVDEFGGTAGIVTLEDLVEALVGPIAEEPVAAGAPPDGGPEPDGSVVLDGLTRLHEFEELLGQRLPDELRDEVETVGGLVGAVLGRVPGVGEEATVAGRTLRVEAKDGHRVAGLRLLPAERTAADGPGTVGGLWLPAGLLAPPADGPLALATEHPAAVAVLRALL
jgi:CBS domain containing-hemolysin-like protein